MKRFFGLILIFSISVINAFAQNFSISGVVAGSNNEPLPGANVMLLNAADSAFLKGSTSDTSGFFEINKISAGKFILKISYLGYRDLFLNKEIINASITIGKIALTEKATTLNQAEVTGHVLPAQMKGDTTQYNADAYKTNKDATSEDLITKMPGVTVQDGKVQAQGEDVKKITVDGRPFFGDDPNAVLKNLPAEVIDKIQVFDKKSDQSQFTGFDDGSNTKTINIVTKPQFRNGTFGKFYGGYGTDDKWKAGFNLNFFKDKRRISILANSNNINEQNFSTEDLLGVIGTSTSGNRGQGQRGSFGGMGGPGGRGGRQGGQDNGASNFLVDQKNGISTTQSIGINYADKWGNIDFTGSYFFNYSENNAKSDLLRTYITQQNAGFIYDEESNVNSKNINHRASLKFDWKIDSLNSILFQPKFSAQINDGGSLLLGQNKLQDSTVSSTLNKYNSNLTGINFSAPVLYRHSFLKKGRTISLNISPGYNQNKGSSYLNSYTDYYNDTLSIDTLNQMANLNTDGTVLSSNVTYTEPLNDISQLMFTYTNNSNVSNSSKETFNYSQSEENYNALDTLLSNQFVSKYFSNSIGTGYQYQKLKWSLTAGLAFQSAQQKSNQDFPYTANVNKTFNSWLPNALFMYRFSMQKNLRINYRTNNTAPTVTQLQNVINNSNPLQLATGNPFLKQDWQNNLMMRYSAINTAKSTAFFTFAGFNYTNDYIANSVLYAIADTLIAPDVLLAAGSQITQPVNLNSFVSARSFSNYSFPITKIKCNLNLNLGINYSRTPGVINNQINYANSSTLNTGFALSSNISEKFDFTISSSVSYNNIANTLQKDLNSSYVNYNSRLKIQAMPYKSWVLQTDITHQFYNGLTASYDQNYFLWNAGIGYKFMENNIAELRLTVFDILQQNQSITRNTTDTYYEDVQSNVLQRFLMLTFTYNLKFFKETKVKS